MSSIPGSGRYHGGGHGNPLQYSCLEKPLDRGAWWATVHRVAKSGTRLTRLSSSSRLPWWLSSKESAYNAENLSLVPGLGRSPGGGHGNPLQYSCLENPMDRGAWQAVVPWVSQSWTQLKQLSSISSRVLS